MIMMKRAMNNNRLTKRYRLNITLNYFHAHVPTYLLQLKHSPDRKKSKENKKVLEFAILKS